MRRWDILATPGAVDWMDPDRPIWVAMPGHGTGALGGMTSENAAAGRVVNRFRSVLGYLYCLLLTWEFWILPSARTDYHVALGVIAA